MYNITKVKVEGGIRTSHVGSGLVDFLGRAGSGPAQPDGDDEDDSLNCDEHELDNRGIRATYRVVGSLTRGVLGVLHTGSGLPAVEMTITYTTKKVRPLKNTKIANVSLTTTFCSPPALIIK